MKVSIVLPNYIPDADVFSYFERFITSLLAFTPGYQYQLLVVDNGTPQEFFQQMLPLLAQVPDFQILHKDTPLGYARAVNVGIGWADHDVIVVANNDIEFTQQWLLEMIDEYGTIIGLLAADDRPNTEPRLYPDESWYSLWMIDRDVWSKVGCLDESLNYRYHDQDYSIRLKKQGYFIGRTGKVRVKHGNSITYNKMKRDEDPLEREEMLRRHGYSTFSEWRQHHHFPR